MGHYTATWRKGNVMHHHHHHHHLHAGVTNIQTGKASKAVVYYIVASYSNLTEELVKLELLPHGSAVGDDSQNSRSGASRNTVSQRYAASCGSGQRWESSGQHPFFC